MDGTMKDTTTRAVMRDLTVLRRWVEPSPSYLR